RAGRRHILKLIPEIATHAPILSGRTGKRWHMLMDPRALKQVLRDRLADYPNSTLTHLVLGPAIAPGMSVAARAHRHSPPRSAARLEALIGQPANLFDEMVTATFEVISDVTFSGGKGFDRAEVHRAIESYIANAAGVSLLDVMGAPAWLPRPGRIFGSRGIG